MTHNITLYQQISRLISSILLYILIFADIMCAFEHKFTFSIYVLGIPLILIFLTVFSRLCHNYCVYTIAHFALFIGQFFIKVPSLPYRLTFIALILIESFLDLYFKKHQKKTELESTPWVFLAIPVISYIIASIFHIVTLTQISYYLGFGLIITYFIRHYLYGLDLQLFQTENTTSFSKRKFILISSSSVLIFIGIFALFCLFLHIFNFDQFFSGFYTSLQHVLENIIKFILYLVAVIRAFWARDGEQKKIVDDWGEIEVSMNAAPPPKWLEILTDVFVITIFSFIVYKLCRLAFKILKNYFKQKMNTDKEVLTYDVEEERTMLEKDDSKKKKRKLPNIFDKNPATRVRKLYRTRIKHYKDLEHKKCCTTKELENQVADRYEESIEELTKIYQKARYSNETLTQQDVTDATAFTPLPLKEGGAK